MKQTQDMSNEKSLHETGYKILGPIMHMWLLSLHQYMSFFSDEPTAFLFCSRAGSRLTRLLEIYESDFQQRYQSEYQMFWTSRLAACKGTFRRRPEAAAVQIAQQYQSRSIEDILRGLLRNRTKALSRIDFTDDALSRRGKLFWNFLKGRSHNAEVLINYLVQCDTAMEDYLKALSDGRRRIVLVDTGWQGTTQRLLMGAFPEYEWKGLYFGKFLNGRTDLDTAVGTIFEARAFDPTRPETAIMHFRHLIEILLESPGPSIEEIPAGQFKRVALRQIEANEVSASSNLSDALFASVCRYIEDQRMLASQPAAILRNYQSVLPELQRFVFFPTKREAMPFTKLHRSEDFGSLGSRPILQHVDTPNTDERSRASLSLWLPGQMALEREEPDQLETQQHAFAQLVPSPLGSGRLPVSMASAEAHVTVITRTRDRPILLERAARSVGSQTHDNYNWVVINDGGAKETVWKVLAAAPVEARKITLLNRRESLGMEAASNIGIRESTSAFIVIHDDDDSWAPNFLTEMVSYLLSDDGRKYGGAIANTQYVSESIRDGKLIRHGAAPYNDWITGIDFATMAQGNIFAPIAFVFRREIYDAIGGFDETLPVLGDWFFNLEFMLRADIALVNTTTAFYHHRDTEPNTGVYSNSVIGGSKRHAEYNPIVKNKFLRKYASTNSAAAVVASLGGPGMKRNRPPRAALQGTQFGAPVGGAQDGVVERELNRLWLLIHVNKFLTEEALAKGISGFRLMSDSESIDNLLEIILTRSIPVPPSPIFDETYYLNRYEDIRKACEQRKFPSGFIHFLAYGHDEGRQQFRRTLT